MDTIRLYPGLAGEVVRQFIRFNTFIVIIPMGIAWLGLALLSHLLENKVPSTYLNYSILIINVVLIALFTGRFAIAAKNGDYHCGFFSTQLAPGDMLAYAIRYIIFHSIWFIPTLLIILYFSQKTHSLELYFLLKLGISLGGSSGIWYAILICLCFFGPLVATLLATYTSSFSEVFSLNPWKWLLFERHADLPAYLSQALGAMLLFFMTYFLPLFIIKIILINIYIKLGFYFDYLLSYLPLFVLPVIHGRLSGAFVSMNGEQSQMNEGESPLSRPDFLGEQKKIYEHFLKTIEQLSSSELEQIEEQAKSEIPNIYQALILSYIYKKNKQLQQALPQAKQTISQCLNEGLGYDALQLFRFYQTERKELALTTESLIQLADYSTLHNAYLDAAWCYIMATHQLPDEEKLAIQKKFLHMADKARQYGEQKTAKNLFSLFCKQYPDSSLTEFARQQIDEC